MECMSSVQIVIYLSIFPFSQPVGWLADMFNDSFANGLVDQRAHQFSHLLIFLLRVNKSWYNLYYFVCIRIDKGDVLAIESKQVIEMKEGNTIAPYTFRRVSNTTFPITLLSREVIRRKLLLF